MTIVVPYAAGGGIDVIARMLAQRLTERLGQPFVVENRLGAGGVIASTFVARAPADGYTLLLASDAQFAIQVPLRKNLPYNPRQGFRADRHCGLHAVCPSRQSLRAGEFAERIYRARQEQAG